MPGAARRRSVPFHRNLVRPDGYGCWSENGSLLEFYLEYDTGTETLTSVAGKLPRYRAAHSDT
jgi:Replication-relaxation